MALKAYPLSSSDGKVIPLDIISPIATGDFSVSSSPLGSPISLGDMTAAVLEIWADVDCRLGFTSVPVTIGTAVYQLRAHDPRLVYIGAESYLSAISTISGNVHYNKIDIWDTLGTQYQLDTRE